MAEEPLLIDLWPEAGQLLGYESKTQTYAAAAAGFIPTVQVSRRRKKVATAVIKRLREEGVLSAEPTPVRRRRRRGRKEAAV